MTTCLNFTRRKALQTACAAAATCMTAAVSRAQATGTNTGDATRWAASAAIAKKPRWSSTDLYDFIIALPGDARARLLAGLQVETKGTPGKQAEAVIKDLQWRSSNILTYSFKSNREIDYAAVVEWVAKEFDCPTANITTVDLERDIFQKYFEKNWDALTPQQRMDVVKRVNAEGGLGLDAASLATATGTAAFATFLVSVGATGFAFYTTMSSVIAAIAATLGVTLPFAAYLGASTAVGLASGPVGWAALGLLTVGSVAVAGRANSERTLGAILAIHGARMEAIEFAPNKRNQLLMVTGGVGTAVAVVAAVLWVRQRKYRVAADAKTISG